MQFKVPQNIDMEDKIVGPLGLTQFAELTLAGLIFYASFRYGGLIVTLFVGLPILLLGLALAFIKVQDQPFSHFALAFAEYLIRPKFRVWQKDPTLERIAIPQVVNPVHNEELAEAESRRTSQAQTHSRLQDLSRLLDTQGETAVEAAGGVTQRGLDQAMAAGKPKTIPVVAARSTSTTQPLKA